MQVSKEVLTITEMLLLHSEVHPLGPWLLNMTVRDHPLCLAAQIGPTEIVQVLVVYGADVPARDRNSQP